MVALGIILCINKPNRVFSSQKQLNQASSYLAEQAADKRCKHSHENRTLSRLGVAKSVGFLQNHKIQYNDLLIQVSKGKLAWFNQIDQIYAGLANA